MDRVRVLDLCCGIGGAGMGYLLAGADVTGIDIRPQPDYPGRFVRADAVDFAAQHAHRFDLVHASPPCQAYSDLTKGTNARFGHRHPDLIGSLRDVLTAAGGPWIMENVPGAPIRCDLMLCGEMFGLRVLRHRWFELCGVDVPAPEHPRHRGRVIGWRHGSWSTDGRYIGTWGAGGGGKGTTASWRVATGIHWSTDRRGIAEAIPPAYTRYIGSAFLALRAATAPGQVADHRAGQQGDHAAQR